MIDTYTKAVLTIIAAALIAVVVQGSIEDASATADGCGDSIRNPCFVTIKEWPRASYSNRIQVDVND